MTDFSPIDHKEKSHEDRAAVLEWVQGQVGFSGSRPTDARAFFGVWQCHYVGVGGGQKTKKLDESGLAQSIAEDGTYENLDDRWVFNEDGSFSYWSYVDAMPEYGLLEPTYSEDRYHPLFRDCDAFVLFNGDGSLIELHERVKP